MTPDATVTQMHWQPPLLKLTGVSHPNVDAGVASPLYIAPNQIIGVERKAIQSQDMVTGDKYPIVSCTIVTISYSLAYQVSESPEKIALMRDKALGHAPKLEAV